MKSRFSLLSDSAQP